MVFKKSKTKVATITEREAETLQEIGNVDAIIGTIMHSLWEVVALKKKESKQWWDTIKEKYNIKENDLTINYMTLEITTKEEDK